MDRDIYERLEASGKVESYMSLSLMPWVEHNNANLA